ncbi:MAG: carotenoid biosynthesis protein [Pyrinomonadaceae bacterium]
MSTSPVAEGTATGAIRANSGRRMVIAVLVMLYAVLWVGGVSHYLFIGAVSASQQWIASAFLTLAGLIVLCSTASRGDLLKLLFVALLGLLVEVCGVSYGVPFGRYAYTGVLQPTLFGVPIVMAFAWMTLVAYVKQMFATVNTPVWLEPTAAAAWMTAIDLVIDPLAANQLGYWRWFERGVYYGIPVSNFAGWFAASLLLFSLLRRPWRPNAWPRWAGLSIILFFTLIAFSYRLFAGALIGLALCALHLSIVSRRFLSRIN